MNSIGDQNKKIDTILSFSSQFYGKILSMVVDSLYSDLMVDDKGFLYLRENLLNGTDVVLDKKTIGYISDLETNVSRITNMVQVAYENSSIGTSADVYVKIQKATLRLKALADILDTTNHSQKYKTYMESPYITEKEVNDMKMEIIVPKVKADMSGLETSSSIQSQDIPSSNTNVIPDAKLQAAQKLFPDANASSFIPE